MPKFGTLNWFYSQTGNWLTINSTDYDAIQNLASEMCQYFSEQTNLTYKQFSAGGGSVMIQNITLGSKEKINIEDLMVHLLNKNGWEQDRTYYSYRRSTE